MSISSGVKAVTYLLFLFLAAITCAASARILDEETPLTSQFAASHPTLSFFVHNVLGGTHPTAVAVSAVAANSAAVGQVAFPNPNGAILPVNNVIPLSGVGNTNRMVPTKPNSRMNAFGLPCLNSAQLPGGKTVGKPLFGKMTVIDDEMTEGHELGSGLVGRAQGFYVVSSEDGSTGQCVALTAMFESGGNADSINFIGVLRTRVSESQVGVMGGTGKYVNAEGYATVKTIRDGKHHDTDGLETILEFTVYLA